MGTYHNQKKIFYGVVLVIMILLGNSGVVTMPYKSSFGLLNDPSMLQMPVDISSESLFSNHQFEKFLQLPKNAEYSLFQDESSDQEIDQSGEDEKKESSESDNLDENQDEIEKNGRLARDNINSVSQEKYYVKYENKEKDSHNNYENNENLFTVSYEK